jgi:hypothetical protein
MEKIEKIYEGKEDEPCCGCLVLPLCKQKTCYELLIKCPDMYKHMIEMSGIFDKDAKTTEVHETVSGFGSDENNECEKFVTRYYKSPNLKRIMKLIRSKNQTRKDGCQIFDLFNLQIKYIQ